MNLLSILSKPYTKEQADAIVSWVGGDQKRFNTLLELFLNADNISVVQRASWPLSYCIEHHAYLIDNYYDELIFQLDAPGKPQAVRRNILRIFDQLPVFPEKYHGPLMDACFRYIEDPNEAIASQAFALGILSKLSGWYPEIRPELVIIIESRLPNAAPAFRSRARKILMKK